MGRKATELGALEVSRLVKPGLHFVGGVAGLALQVTPPGVRSDGSRSWVLRIKVGIKRREMGLGGFPDVGLADARRRAKEERENADKGLDPVGERQATKARLKADQALQFTFEEDAKAYIKANEAGWKNAKHAAQWKSTLETYAYPIIGKLQVREITTGNVLSVLSPIWQSKTETASRLRGRIEVILDYSKTMKHRVGENPALWQGGLDTCLPRKRSISPVEHHMALPVGEVGKFVAELRNLHGMSAKSLQFAILTAARSGEVRGATWEEIDLEKGVWVVPKERMKAGREHRVPLSTVALKLLHEVKAMPKIAGNDFVFQSARGGQLSDMAMTATCRRLGGKCVPHGFRSSFRDWVGDRTTYQTELAEFALAHGISDKVEASYARGTMFDKRRAMMEDWAAFVSKSDTKGTVVPINSKAAA